VIVIDGLDEAHGEVFTIAEDLLARLAAFATVIVSTRPASRGAGPPYSLIDVLAPAGLLDLDAPPQQASQAAAIGGYVQRRLTDVSPVMDPGLIAAELSHRAGAGQESFSVGPHRG